MSPMAAERHISKTSLRQRRCAVSDLTVRGGSSAFVKWMLVLPMVVNEVMLR